MPATPTLQGVRRLVTGLLVLLCSCAYVLPASWRSFRTDPDDAGPAINRALDERQIEIKEWNQAEHRIVSGWSMTNDGLSKQRERYVISWERDEDDGTLTVYVRHEMQDRELTDGRPSWTTTYHVSDKEQAMLDAITKQLVDANAPMESPP